MGTGVAGLGLVGAGYAGIGGQDGTTRDDSGAVVEGGDLGAFRIQLGDCLQDMGSGTFESVPAVPCAEPHTYEVYGAFMLPSGAYPGLAAVNQAADEGCYERFAPFTGIAFEQSPYGFSSITPTSEGWAELDDREILCLIGDPNGGTVTGSLARSGA